MFPIVLGTIAGVAAAGVLAGIKAGLDYSEEE